LEKKRTPTEDKLGKKRKSSIMIRKLGKKKKNAISISSVSRSNSYSKLSDSDFEYS